jgi:hypothetical protein
MKMATKEDIKSEMFSELTRECEKFQKNIHTGIPGLYKNTFESATAFLFEKIVDLQYEINKLKNANYHGLDPTYHVPNHDHYRDR